MFLIIRDGRPVMNEAKGQPREFKTRADAESWAKLSCYHSFKIKLKGKDSCI